MLNPGHEMRVLGVVGILTEVVVEMQIEQVTTKEMVMTDVMVEMTDATIDVMVIDSEIILRMPHLPGEMAPSLSLSTCMESEATVQTKI